MTINELKVTYANEILKSNDKEKATLNVIKKIDELTYENGGKISTHDKKILVDGIADLLTPKDKNGRRVILCEKDNSNYLTMLSAVSSELAKVTGGK